MDDELRELLSEAPPEDRDRLANTIAALRAVPDEEPPRRIAFVSDKVFEPKWWQRFPAWGFASATALAAAIVTHGYVTRPVTQVIPAQAPAVSAPVDAKALEVQLDQKIEMALRKASAENDARVKAAVEETERRLNFEHRAALLTVEENMNLMRKQMNRMFVATADLGDAR
jgi:predicted RNA-binding protein with RPS1 domain